MHTIKKQSRWYLVLAFHASQGCKIQFVSPRYLRAAAELLTGKVTPVALRGDLSRKTLMKIAHDVNTSLDEVHVKMKTIKETSPQAARDAYTAEFPESHLVAVYCATGGPLE